MNVDEAPRVLLKEAQLEDTGRDEEEEKKGGSGEMRVSCSIVTSLT